MYKGGTRQQSKGPHFNPELGLLSRWSFACIPCAPVGFLQVLRFPQTYQKHAGSTATNRTFTVHNHMEKFRT